VENTLLKGGASDSDEEDILVRDLVDYRPGNTAVNGEPEEKTKEALGEAKQRL
jgi:hypothetical protein